MGSQIFFLDKKSETCQKNFSSGEITTLSDIYNIPEINTSGRIFIHYTHFHMIIAVFEFESFWIIIWRFARCEIFFLDKRSEACQKNFHSQEIKTLIYIYNIPEIAISGHISVHFLQIHMIYGVI